MINLKQDDYSLIDLDYRTPVPTQGDFKTLSLEDEQKLLTSYTEKKIFRPALTVWTFQDTDEKIIHYLIDGHQTQYAFKKNDVRINGGYVIKCLLIKADSLDDAKEKLLIINSEYGKKDYDGFMRFAKGLKMDRFDWISKVATFEIKGMTLPSMNLDFKQRIEQANKANLSLINVSAPPVTPNNPPLTDENTSTKNKIITPIVRKIDQKLAAKGKATDNDHTSFNVIMKIGDYDLLIATLNKARQNGIGVDNPNLADALTYIVKFFNQNHSNE